MKTCRSATAVAYILLAGCAYNVNVKPLDVPEIHAGEPIPAAIGVYYSPEFMTYEATGKFRHRAIETDLGPASHSLFEPLLRSAFAEARPVHSAEPPELAAGEIEAVLIPKIVSFWAFASSRAVGVRFLGPFRAVIGYELAVRHANGSSLTLSAKSEVRDSVGTVWGTDEIISDAMRAATAELWVALQAAPRGEDWFNGLQQRLSRVSD